MFRRMDVWRDMCAQRMHMCIFAFSALFFFVISASHNTQAATAIGNLTVQIVIEGECTVVTTSTVDFGTEGVLDAVIDVAGSISVQCTTATTYDVGLDAGVGAGATTSARVMTGPASATIDYSLFRDVTRLLNWGDTVSTDTLGGVGTGSVQVLDVYGRVPIQTTPGVGTYTDTVQVTVTY